MCALILRLCFDFIWKFVLWFSSMDLTARAQVFVVYVQTRIEFN